LAVVPKMEFQGLGKTEFGDGQWVESGAGGRKSAGGRDAWFDGVGGEVIGLHVKDQQPFLPAITLNSRKTSVCKKVNP
jgi:hypothetical protein